MCYAQIRSAVFSEASPSLGSEITRMSALLVSKVSWCAKQKEIHLYNASMLLACRRVALAIWSRKHLLHFEIDGLSLAFASLLTPELLPIFSFRHQCVVVSSIV